MKYILLILSCKKYAHKRKMQLETWLQHIPQYVSYFHVIGDKERCGDSDFSFDMEERILYVNTKDDYLSLPSKIITAIHAVHQTIPYDYILKTDDDQMLIQPTFFEILDSRIQSHHYGGYTINVDNHYSTYWTVHNELPKKLFLEKATYCNGRFYFLSQVAVKMLLEMKTSISSRIIEDHAIGYHLLGDVKQSIWRMNDIILSSFIDDVEYVSRKHIIYTECVNCPEICLNAILSYQCYHPYPVHIYLTPTDMVYFEKHKSRYDLSKIIFQCVNESMINIYEQDGHLGTAIIWENVIRSYPSHNIIHFDSDVIFRGDAVNDIIHGLYSNDLVGPIRCYKNNLNGRDDIRHQPDVISTYCFGFKASMVHVNQYKSKELIFMIRGYSTPLPFHILDFFDPVSYVILHHGGKMKTIDFNIIGGLNQEGSKLNSYPILNTKMDCGDKIIHFASVGTGLSMKKAMKKGCTTQIPQSYVEHSFRTLATYQYLLFGLETDELEESIKGLRAYFNELVSIPFVPITF